MRPYRLTAPVAVVALCFSVLSSPVGGAEPSAAPLPPLVDVPEYRANADRTGVYPGPGPIAEPALVWSRTIDATINFNPMLADGMVLFGGQDKRFYALDARTGEERWQFEAADVFGRFGSVADGIVAVASADGVLHALDLATGTELWSHPGIGLGNAIVDGVVYAPGTNNDAYGLDLATGEVRWSWTAPENVVYLTESDGTAYLSVDDSRLYAISIADGTERWHVQVLAAHPGVTEVEGDTVYVSGETVESDMPTGELYVIDRDFGAVRWRFRTATGMQITLGAESNGSLYAGTLDGSGLFAFPTAGDESGAAPSPLWHTPTAAAAYKNQVLSGDLLYVPIQGPDEVVALGVDDGEIRWHVLLGEVPNGIMVSGGMLFVSDQSGTISAYAESAVRDAIGPVSSGALGGAATVAMPPDPFTIVRTLDPSTTTLQKLLAFDIGPDGLIYAIDSKPSLNVIDPASGSVIRSWGSQGSREGEFDFGDPNGNRGGDIAVSPSGDVFVADGANHRVQVFASDGTFIRAMGSFGSGDGQFSRAHVVAAGSDGSTYVGDEPGGSLTRFGPGGAFMWRVPGVDQQFASFLDVVELPDGRLDWLRENGHMVTLDPSTGDVVDAWGQPGNDPGSIDFGCDLSVDAVGNEYVVTCNGMSQVFDPGHQLIGGEYKSRNDKLLAPVFGPNGEVFATDWFASDDIYILDDALLAQ